MTDLEAECLDDLLSLWHGWQLAGKSSRGFAPRALVIGDFRISRQYDDQNGALDAELDHQRCKAVDYAAQSMADPYRAAIYMEARNLYTGAAVWISPRLPADLEEREVIVNDARSQMVYKLRSAGVLTDI